MVDGSWLGRLRSSRFVGVLVGLVAVGSGGLVVVAGVAPRDSVVKLLDGSALLRDETHGAYVHVSGATGRVDLKGTLGKDAKGKRMTIVQRDGHAYVAVDTGGGHRVLYQINDSTLTDGKSRRIGVRDRLVRGGEE